MTNEERSTSNDAQSTKHQVPSAEAQRSAESQIRKLLRDDFAGATDHERRVALVRELMKLGGESEGDAATAYVMLRMAGDAAAAMGDLPLAIEAMDAIGAAWEIDAWSRKAAAAERAIESLWQSRRDPHAPSAESVFAAASDLGEAAVEADQYAVAGEVLEMLTKAAQRARNADLVRELAEREKRLAQREKQYAAYQTAVQTLDSFPGDSDARLTAGRWLGLVKGRWDQALPLLAKSSDQVWGSLAQLDLAGPTEAAAQVALADTWWKQAQKEKRPQRSHAARRAAYWYNQAVKELPPLEKIPVNSSRLEALSTVGDPDASDVAGAVAEGNVALASNGTTLSGEKITYPDRLLDGALATSAYSKCPCQWIITFTRPYRLQEIRLHLYSSGEFTYHYAVATSTDGRNYGPLVERLAKNDSSFEQIEFPSRSVKSIKLLGIASTYTSDLFMVGELEAYCIRPDLASE